MRRPRLAPPTPLVFTARDAGCGLPGCWRPSEGGRRGAGRTERRRSTCTRRRRTHRGRAGRCLRSNTRLGRPYARFRRTLTNAKDPRLNGEQPRFSFKTPKTRAGIRDVKLPPELVIELKLRKSECPESPHGLVFPNQAGQPMRRETVLDHLHATQRKADIPKRDVKALRHTAATSMIAAGKPYTEVAYALGHKDANVTRAVYAHWYRNQKSEGAGHLAKQILGQETPPPNAAPPSRPDARGDFLETFDSTDGYLN